MIPALHGVGAVAAAGPDDDVEAGAGDDLGEALAHDPRPDDAHRGDLGHGEQRSYPPVRTASAIAVHPGRFHPRSRRSPRGHASCRYRRGHERLHGIAARDRPPAHDRARGRPQRPRSRRLPHRRRTDDRLAAAAARRRTARAHRRRPGGAGAARAAHGDRPAPRRGDRRARRLPGRAAAGRPRPPAGHGFDVDERRDPGLLDPRRSRCRLPHVGLRRHARRGWPALRGCPPAPGPPGRAAGDLPLRGRQGPDRRARRAVARRARRRRRARRGRLRPDRGGHEPDAPVVRDERARRRPADGRGALDVLRRPPRGDATHARPGAGRPTGRSAATWPRSASTTPPSTPSPTR